MKEHQGRSSGGLLRAATVVPCVIALSTFLVYSAAFRNGFVNLDDGVNFLRNPHYRGFDWANLRWMFLTSPRENYEPLSWLLYAAVYGFSGMKPWGYHLAGVLLHVLATVVLYAATVRLLKLAAPDSGIGGAAALRWSAGIAALLFALHPLRVEAVAWISGQHHVLAALFFLISIWSYLKAFESRTAGLSHRGWLAASLASYALSLLSFPIGITLPAVLLILDEYLCRCRGDESARFDLRSSLMEKLPFLILAGLGGAAAVRARAAAKMLIPATRLGATQRFLEALYGAAFYLWKTLMPFGLTPLYPSPKTIALLAAPSFLSGVLLALLTLGAVAARRRRPAVLAVWAYYLLTLLPVLGSAQGGTEIVQDRYTYLSSFGFAVLTAGALNWLWNEKGPRVWRTAAALAGALLVVLSGLTWRQINVWRDSEVLWRHVLSINPESTPAQNDLGAALFGQGKTDAALQQFDSAVKAQPGNSAAQSNMGLILAGQGKSDEAIRHYDLALQSRPEDAATHYNLGLALAGQGKLDEAIRQYELALQAQPDFAQAHSNLGKIFAGQGNLNKAIQEFEMALKAQPDLASAQNNLGLALATQGKLDEAIRHYNTALALGSQPDLPFIHNNLATALASQGKTDKAILHLREALRLKPDFTSARENLSILLKRAGRPGHD